MTETAATLSSAEAEAAAAARRAAVTIRELSDAPSLRAVAELFAEVWRTPAPPFPYDLMRSLADAGGRVHAAYRGPQLAGASVAVFGPPATASCYSLVAGVSPAVERRGIGLALKLAQRAWALAEGAASMRWTFDPLLRRNAFFNIGRLGATAGEYLADFYGDLGDGVNDPVSDRLAVTWDLRAALPDAGPPASPGEPGDAGAVILAAGPGEEPEVTWPAGGGAPAPLRCWIPPDALAMRKRDPALASRWRLAMRAALGGAIRAGYQVTRLAQPGWYMLERTGALR